MKRTTTVLLAALDALLAPALGLGIVLVPLVLIWATQFGLSGDGFVVWRAAADIWLLGHGVDLKVQLDDLTAVRVATPGSDEPFELTMAVLGFAALTTAIGIRAGRRGALTGHPWLTSGTAVVVFSVLTALIVLSAEHPAVSAVVWQGFILPPLVLALGLLVGLARERRHLSLDGIAALPEAVRVVARGAIRGGLAVVAGVIGVAAVVVAVLVVVDYSTIVGLYETLHVDVSGAIALTIGQLAFLPNLVVWAASWLLGPGFTLGVGSSVSPGATLVGPLPGVPVLGILPGGSGAIGYLGLLVPVVLGFVAGMLVERRIAARSLKEGSEVGAAAPSHRSLAVALATGATIGVVAGLVLGLLAWWSSGAVGPGRLVDVGPDPWLVAGATALASGIPAVVGTLAARVRANLAEE